MVGSNWYRGQVNKDAFITGKSEGDGVMLEKGEDKKRFFRVTDNRQ